MYMEAEQVESHWYWEQSQKELLRIRTSHQIEEWRCTGQECGTSSQFDLGCLIQNELNLVEVVQYAPEWSHIVLEQTSLYWKYALYYNEDSIKSVCIEKGIKYDTINYDENEDKSQYSFGDIDALI